MRDATSSGVDGLHPPCRFPDPAGRAELMTDVCDAGNHISDHRCLVYRHGLSIQD